MTDELLEGQSELMEDHLDAGYVRADHVDIDKSGAAIVQADTVSIIQGGAGRVRARELSIRQGGVGVARTQSLHLESQSGVGVAIANDVEVGDGGAVMLLFAARASGNVRPLIDWRAALVFGTALAVVSAVLRRH